MVLSLSTQSVSVIFFDEPGHLIGIDMLDFLEQPKIVADLLGDFDERAQILREAASAETERGVEKPPSNPLVHAHAVRDFVRVDAEELAVVAQFVDERNTRGQIGIGGVLDHLGGPDVGEDQRDAVFGDGEVDCF